MVNVGEDALRFGGEADQRVQRVVAASKQQRLVRDRRDHQMAVRVGIAVQHHQRVIGAEDRQRVAECIGVDRIAEDAAIGSRSWARSSRDISRE